MGKVLSFPLLNEKIEIFPRKVLESQGYRLEVAADTEKVLPGACFKIVFSEDTMEVN